MDVSSATATRLVVLGLLLGIVGGSICYVAFPQWSTRFAEIVGLLPTAFLRLIKMIIAPLVLSTLVAGIARTGDGTAVRRIGLKALGWFLVASVLSLGLGLGLAAWLEPGRLLQLALPQAPAATAQAEALSIEAFIAHTIPTSIVDSMARNEILHIVVFSVLFGAAMTALPARSRCVVDVLDAVSGIMLKLTGYVMLLAPFAVFGALASTIAREGFGIIGVYGLFIGEYYAGLVVLWIALVCLGALVIGDRIRKLIHGVREPVLLAFATASSEAAYPQTLAALERFGCSNRVASFVLPLGYSFNLDGSMMYCTFGVMFIAQAYGVHLTLADQTLMLAILLLTSKGIAGVPRASLIVIAATLPQFGIPDAGMLLLLGIDHFLDMGRSATNVIGNSVATAAVSKWERELASEGESAKQLKEPSSVGYRQG